MRSMTLAALFSLSLLLAGPVLAQGKCERLTATGNMESAPYLWRDAEHPGRFKGADAELLAHIGSELGITIELVDSADPATAQAAVEAGRVDLLVGVLLDGARLEKMDFIHPAFFYSQSLVWVRADAVFPYNSWADLKGRKGALLSGSGGAVFGEYAEHELNLRSVVSVEEALAALMSGELDYVVAERYPALIGVREQQLEDDILPLDIPLSSDAVFLALSHDSACNDAWLRGRLAQSMMKLVATGVPEQLLHEAVQSWQQSRQED